MNSTPNTTFENALKRRIQNREATIGVIGLGYVGLPLALTFAERDFQVLGFDVDSYKVEALHRGESYILHQGAKRIQRAVESGHLAATSDFSRLCEPDALLICVPTPLTTQREPDMRYVEATAKQIAAVLRREQLVVLESTTYPGTTDELVRTILESSGLTCGVDFLLAFSPEREDPGNPDFSTSTIPKVVGGVDPQSGNVAQTLYDAVIERTVRVSSARTAEATKLTENIFRAVNIALVNELKMVYDRMDIDVWEVLDASSTKPFGFMRFNPGPGWGGHCIPIDPFYLSWKARESGIQTRFIELAGEVNIEMTEFVVSKLMLALNSLGKAVNGAKVLVLGVAYKKDIDDARESPAFVILDRLIQLGAEVSYHDPHVLALPETRRWKHLPSLESQPLGPAMLSQQDAVLIITDHSAVDYSEVQEHATLIVDTRGVIRENADHVVKA